LTPGCIQRLVVIFEGKENIGKSTLVQALGAPWNRVLSRGLETKEAVMLMTGCWVMEVPELDSFSRAEDSAIKAFVTTTEDTIVRKYENEPTLYPRRTVLVGTVNPTRPYLKGQTGNTRFLPVLLRQIDVPGFVAVRDQLLAEAKALIETGAAWWEELPEYELEEIREARREVDVYEQRIAEWLTRRVEHEHLDYFTMEEVLQKALNISDPERWKDISLVTRIGIILARERMSRKRKKINNKLFWVYEFKN
jgi:predicted P-loop ATPase